MNKQEVIDLLETAKSLMGHTKANLNVSFAKSKINEAIKKIETWKD